MRSLKRAALSILTSVPVAPVLPVTNGGATVLMLHRFAQPDLGVVGHDPDALRTMLATLRGTRRPLVPLARLVDAARGGAPVPRGAVVFTVDDGYRDFADVGAPVFADYDCPVTVFLATGFVDRKTWCWWDRAEYALTRTTHARLALEMSSGPFECSWKDSRDRAAALEACVEALKGLPGPERLAQLDEIARRLEVAVPALPPEPWAAMEWDDVRRLARAGVTFGPHSVTHPILSRVSDAESEREVSDSWTRLCAEVPEPLPVFCYPNGTLDSFGEREAAAIERTGLALALACTEGYVTTERLRSRGVRGRYALPRFSYGEDPIRNRAVALGLARESRDCRDHFGANAASLPVLGLAGSLVGALSDL